jgi:hypothetical protein
MVGFLCKRGKVERAKKIEEDPFEQEKNIRYYIGSIIILFAYEVYKEKGEDVDALIRDFIFSSPQKIVEEVIERIKNDSNKQILREAISDLSCGSEMKKWFRPRERYF